MDQEYTPEQQTIRFNCRNHRRATVYWIKQEKWDRITMSPCPPECTLCQNPVMGVAPLKYLFVFPPSFTPDIQAVIERLYGPQTQDDWYNMLQEHVPSFSILQYFIQNQLIDITRTHYDYSLFTTYSYHYPKDIFHIWDSLLSEGYMINLQDPLGNHALLVLLLFQYEEEEEEDLLESNERITYLLQHGADPLLENKEGVSAWSYVCDVSSQETKDRLLPLLEPYL